MERSGDLARGVQGLALEARRVGVEGLAGGEDEACDPLVVHAHEELGDAGVVLDEGDVVQVEAVEELGEESRDPVGGEVGARVHGEAVAADGEDRDEDERLAGGSAGRPGAGAVGIGVGNGVGRTGASAAYCSGHGIGAAYGTAAQAVVSAALMVSDVAASQGVGENGTIRGNDRASHPRFGDPSACREPRRRAIRTGCFRQVDGRSGAFFFARQNSLRSVNPHVTAYVLRVRAAGSADFAKRWP
ncbi:hypothetical protein [Streptomyces sp. NPDC002082]|uniref:hypothetical protein n=1 Tax=Streptomyces sp. NPDC002082 TaxID=3154772 RepID=UPI00331C4F94